MRRLAKWILKGNRAEALSGYLLVCSKHKVCGWNWVSERRRWRCGHIGKSLLASVKAWIVHLDDSRSHCMVLSGKMMCLIQLRLLSSCCDWYIKRQRGPSVEADSFVGYFSHLVGESGSHQDGSTGGGKKWSAMEVEPHMKTQHERTEAFSGITRTDMSCSSLVP